MATEPPTNPEFRPTCAARRSVRQRICPPSRVCGRPDRDPEIRPGSFPKPMKLTEAGRAKGWLEAELIDWQAKRLAMRELRNCAPCAAHRETARNLHPSSATRAISRVRRLSKRAERGRRRYASCHRYAHNRAPR